MKSPIARWHDEDKNETQIDLRAVVMIVKITSGQGKPALNVRFNGVRESFFCSFQSSEHR